MHFYEFLLCGMRRELQLLRQVFKIHSNCHAKDRYNAAFCSYCESFSDVQIVSLYFVFFFPLFLANCCRECGAVSSRTSFRQFYRCSSCLGRLIVCTWFDQKGEKKKREKEISKRRETSTSVRLELISIANIPSSFLQRDQRL